MWLSGRRLRIILRQGVRIYPHVVFQGSGCIEVGERSFVGQFSVIGSNASVKIGRDVMIAQAVSIRDSDHNSGSRKLPMNQQGISAAAVVIEDDVWIGHGATVLKGVKVGRGSVVAAGAVVVKDVPAFTIVGGVPAHPIAERAADD